MTIFVGSTNPVKINAVQQAAIDHWPDLKVQGFATKSGINEQPLTDEETRQGALNRAQGALAEGLDTVTNPAKPILGIGLEGGVFTDDDQQMWSTVWAVVVDSDGKVFEANGARVKVPATVAQIISQGEEMGPILQKLTGVTDVRKKQGMFGVITNNFVNRTEEYSALAKMALGLWYGQGWEDKLTAS